MDPIVLVAPLVLALPAPPATGAVGSDAKPDERAPVEVQAPAGSKPSASWTPPVLHALTLFTTVRVAEAVIWPDPFAETDLGEWGRHYREAFTRLPLFDPDRPAFSWDGDRWEINVIGHGLMGSELYLRARQCHFGWGGAFAFTAGATAVWEYGFEANGVRPSGQDLVFTPVAGLALGEARYQLWNAADGIEPRPLRFFVRTVLDPFGELERRTGIFDC